MHAGKAMGRPLAEPAKGSPFAKGAPPPPPPPASRESLIMDGGQRRASAPPPAASRTVGKYELHSGPKPAAAPRGKRHDEAYKAALNLVPGGWFTWHDAPKTSYKQVVKRWGELSSRMLSAYKAAGGKVIVERDEKCTARGGPVASDPIE